MEENLAVWPGGLHRILDQISRTSQRFGIILPNEWTADAVQTVKAESIASVSIGAVATGGTEFPEERVLIDQIGDSVVLTDAGILFDRHCPLNPIVFLRRVARTGPRIVVWPDHVEGENLAYGAPESLHRKIWDPENVLLLTPVRRRFPDEMPFTEKWVI